MAQKPVAIARISRGQLSPISAWDAELLAELPDGSEFDLVPRSKRSGAHNSLYWLQLGRIVKATGAWPDSQKMHDWIKVKLGYTSPIFGPNGTVIGMTVDSTSFEKMKQPEFNAYHEAAIQLIAAELGIDVADL
jgi:hypothetical protein